MPRIRRPLLLPALIIFIAASAFVFIVLKKPEFPSFLTPKSTTVSWSVLEEIRNIQELETAVYDLQAVFPFDFTGKDEVDWYTLKSQYDLEPSLFLLKADPSWHPGNRLPPEWKHAEIYNLCREIGIDPGRPDYRFIVISASVEAGVDIDEWENHLTDPETGQITGIDTYLIEQDTWNINLLSPPVEITSYIINDQEGWDHGFPDIPLSPESWRLLTQIIKPKIIDMALDAGLLEKAREESESLLSEIFKAAGFHLVRFL